MNIKINIDIEALNLANFLSLIAMSRKLEMLIRNMLLWRIKIEIKIYIYIAEGSVWK